MNRGAGDLVNFRSWAASRQREILNARRSLHVGIDHELELVSRDNNAYALVPSEFATLSDVWFIRSMIGGTRVTVRVVYVRRVQTRRHRSSSCDSLTTGLQQGTHVNSQGAKSCQHRSRSEKKRKDCPF
jgi:hypothetical protein